jgi:hypothetical protein
MSSHWKQYVSPRCTPDSSFSKGNMWKGSISPPEQSVTIFGITWRSAWRAWLADAHARVEAEVVAKSENKMNGGCA